MKTTRLAAGLALALTVLVGDGASSNADAAAGGTDRIDRSGSASASAPSPRPIVPPPTIPPGRRARGGDRRHVIPPGFLPEEERARVPLSQPDVYWVRNEGARLPSILTPCGRPLRSGTNRVDGRQLVLIGPSLWKAARLEVYRDVRRARAAVAEIRTALHSCERQERANGETTVWTSAPLPIGDEALFVGGEEFRGAQRVPGIFRGVVMRSGRAVQVYLVCGQATETPTPPTDVAHDEATAMAQRLADARWAQSP